MIETKRGLSDVVTTVLIILVAMAAVVIVASFVLRMTDNLASSASAVQCTSVGVEPVSCTSNTTDATIVYKWSSGEDLTAVSVAVEGDNKVRNVARSSAPSSVLGTQSVTISRVSVSGQLSAIVAPILMVDGEEVACPESPVVITCA